MTELEQKIASYEKGIKVLKTLKKEENELKLLENELNKPDVDLKKATIKIKNLKEKVRACNKELNNLGLVGNVDLISGLEKQLFQLKKEKIAGKVKEKAKLYGKKIANVKEEQTEKIKKYAQKNREAILNKAKEIIEQKKALANKKGNKKSEKISLPALLGALVIAGSSGLALFSQIKKPSVSTEKPAIVEIEEEPDEKQNQFVVHVNNQAVYKSHKVDNEYGFLNFREEPALTSNIITELSMGKTVYIQEGENQVESDENGNNWKKAIVYDSENKTYLEGYVDANLVSELPQEKASVIIKEEDVSLTTDDNNDIDSNGNIKVNKYSVNAPLLNFRDGPSTETGDILSGLTEGKTVFLYGDEQQTDAQSSDYQLDGNETFHDWKKAMVHDENAGLYVGGYVDAQYVAEPQTEQSKNDDQIDDNVIENNPEDITDLENTTEPEISNESEAVSQTESKTSEQPDSEPVIKQNGQYADIDAFNEYPGYKEYLLKLKEQHPNWTFVPYKVGLDFNSCVNAEYNAREVAIQEGIWSAPWYAPEYILIDGSSWILPSKEAVACMMDARNFINEDQIFQFESTEFSESQTVEVIKSMLAGVPWANADKFSYTTTTGEVVTMDESFADIIYKAAKEHNISATYLASKIMTEQGQGETASSTACGTVDGYLGLYNYGNVNSYGYGDQVWISGLEWAKASGWTTPEISVNALAEFLKENYINMGQNTVYLTKYNFDINGNPTHQYMTNFTGAYTEAQHVVDKYKSENLLNNPYTFAIPVYENMPEKLSQMPDEATYVDSSKINGGVMHVEKPQEYAKVEFVIPEAVEVAAPNNEENIVVEEELEPEM